MTMSETEIKKHILVALAFDWAHNRVNEILRKEDADLRLRILEEIGKKGGAMGAELIARTALHAAFDVADGADPPAVVLQEFAAQVKSVGGLEKYRFDINASEDEKRPPTPTSRRPKYRRGKSRK